MRPSSPGCHPSFEVGRRNVGSETGFETITQAVLKPGDVTRNLVRSQSTDLSTDCSYLVSAAFGRLEPLSLGLLDRSGNLRDVLKPEGS
jgi:hypothetical protein